MYKWAITETQRQILIDALSYVVDNSPDSSSGESLLLKELQGLK